MVNIGDFLSCQDGHSVLLGEAGRTTCRQRGGSDSRSRLGPYRSLTFAQLIGRLCVRVPTPSRK